MANHSKRIGKADESAKELIIEILGHNVTYGFDVDSIYYIRKEEKWILIELLKCDHKTVTPRNSHPRRYWNKNWRKFAALWKLRNDLDAELYLVNYEDEGHANMQGRKERQFLVINVKKMDPKENGGITSEKSLECDYSGFRDWFLDINSRAGK